MDSQLTLVDPAPVSLIFDSNSMTNATLRINSAPAYTISTDSRGTTEIRAAGSDDVLARVVRKGLLPDTISFPTLDDGKELRLSRCSNPRSFPMESLYVLLRPTSESVSSGNIDNIGSRCLFTEHDAENPVAYLQRPTVATPVPLALVLQPGTEHFRAQIIAAFIIHGIPPFALDVVSLVSPHLFI
ncbi:hypothetical protein FB451DRAFT_1570903 [Mycena latifolia]|nr:hypothetical protein FB451DRAFT_1570903 [Mycena latifolia]